MYLINSTGHVLNIECVPLKFRQYGRWADPDRCHYRQHKDMVSSHIIMLRIYYIAGQPTASQIGELLVLLPILNFLFGYFNLQ